MNGVAEERPAVDDAEDDDRRDREEELRRSPGAPPEDVRKQPEKRGDAEDAREAADRLGDRGTPRFLERHLAEVVGLERHDDRLEVDVRLRLGDERRDVDLRVALRLRKRFEEGQKERRGEHCRDGHGAAQREEDPRVGPLLHEDDPGEVEQGQEEDVRRGLGMAAEEDRRPDSRGGGEAPERSPLRDPIDQVQHGRRPARGRHVWEMQPAVKESCEAEDHRADDAGQLRIAAPAAEEKRERQRDQDLHRRLGGHEIRRWHRQREQADRREPLTLSVREQRIAGPGHLVPQGRLQRLPALAHLNAPHGVLQRNVVHLAVDRFLHVGGEVPRRERVQEVILGDDVVLRQRLEEEDQHQREEEERHLLRELDSAPPRQRNRARVQHADVDPCPVHIQFMSSS